MSQRAKRRIISEINITPLTDIFLVLLIIMMVIAPMLDSQGLKLAVPSASPSADVTKDPQVMTLHVSAGGQYQLQNQPIQLIELQAQLKQMKAEFPDGLMIQAEGKAPHGSVVKAMDAARGAGISKIAVSASDE